MEMTLSKLVRCGNLGKATFKVEKIEHGPLVDNLYQIDEELYNKRVSEGKTIGEGFIITGLFGIPSGFAGTSRMSELEFRNKFNR